MLSRRTFIGQAGVAIACSCCNLRAASAMEGPRVCTELVIQNYQVALEIAVDENPSNAPGNEAAAGSEAISLYKKKWNPNRRILNISFLSEPSYLQKVIDHARGWEPYMGLKFRFGNSNPDVLIAFDEGGSWSFIGTDSRFYAQRSQASMNFGWFTNSTQDEEFRRTTLHEFGHALSLVHEHSHPSGDISWNKAAAYAYYAKQGWSKEDVDQQVFTKYQLTQINGSDYDQKSIMHYPIPEELVTDKSDVVGWNTDLSPLDKTVMSGLYPSGGHSIPRGGMKG